MNKIRAKKVYKRLLPNFVKDQSGNVMPILAAALIPTMVMIGSGIDFGRAYLAQSKLQGAVDAGALAAVRAKQLSSNSSTDSELIGQQYINANFPNGYMGSTMNEEELDVTEIDDLIKAEVKMAGLINTTLLRLAGIKTLPFSASASAEASETLPTSVEALLVLDNTGSMEGSRMSALKSSAKNFVDVIYGNKNTREGFAVGVLPYNTMVNVGHLVKQSNSWMIQDRPGFTDISPSDAMGWKGCVFADETIQNISSDPDTVDAGAFDITNNMPGEDGMPKIEPFIYPPVYVDSFQDVNNRYKIPTSRQDAFFEIPVIRNALIRLHGNDICKNTRNGNARQCDRNDAIIDFDRLPDKNQYVAPRNYSHKSGGRQSASPNNIWGASPNYQCPSQAAPISYSATKSSLKAYVDGENYALKPGTGTFHNPAMTWAYRLMSRDDIFPRNRPVGKPVKRVVIFMTDGNFDSRDDGRNSSSGRILDTAYTAYKTYEDRVIIPTTSRDDTIDNLAYRFAKTCEAMKRDGIELYTIAFSLSNNARGNATREMFKSCATDRNTHFFSAANGTQLNEAFVTIASELVDLRLTN